MDDIIYNTIGAHYNANRAADHRITDRIVALLDLPVGSVIADIGAGTGNYSNALANRGYRVFGIEPSEKMRAQAISHPLVSWLAGVAESIPLSNNAVDGIIIILASHHFASLQLASAEFKRICSDGPVVMFTFDPRRGETPWFNNYFKDIYQKDFISFKPIDNVAETVIGNSDRVATIEEFPLPHDLSDKNMYSAWREPERYLDEQFRQNTSGLALASPQVVQKGVARLKEDLQTGIWDQKFGKIREQLFFNAGFNFIKYH